jgi:hypothetical protein
VLSGFRVGVSGLHLCLKGSKKAYGKRMRLLSLTPKTGVLAGLACLGLVATAWFTMDWVPNPARDVEPAPAAIVSLRFPDERGPVSVASSTPPSTAPAGLENQRLAPPLFIPDLISHPFWQAAGQTPEQASEYADQSSAETSIRGSLSATVGSQTSATRPQRRGSRAAALFNDAQIASMKGRLKLTPDQAAYWLPVETALREVAWSHAHERPGTKAPPTLDRNSIARLQLAAAPLIMHLREDQKRELRMLAHIVGLEKLVSQF